LLESEVSGPTVAPLSAIHLECDRSAQNVAEDDHCAKIATIEPLNERLPQRDFSLESQPIALALRNYVMRSAFMHDINNRVLSGFEACRIR
jgi:hypothetical protein